MFEFWNRGFLNKLLIVSGIIFIIITMGVVNSIANDDLERLDAWASFALVDFMFMLIGFWGADY